MEAFAVLLVLSLVVIVFVLPIAAFIRSGQAAREAERLEARITALELELARLRTAQEQRLAPPQAVAEAVSARASRPPEQPAEVTPAVVREPSLQTRPPEPVRPPPVAPPRIPPIPERQPALSFEKLKGSLNWEQFMGATLFAWIGGFALFLAVAYF